MCVCFQLISLIENNSVVIVRGATGSGKTTQLPQFILDHYNEKNATCNIVVTQPRKIGASSIARWVAAERKCALGSLVGYQVGAKFKWTGFTELKNDTHARLIGVQTEKHNSTLILPWMKCNVASPVPRCHRANVAQEAGWNWFRYMDHFHTNFI